MWYIDLSSLVFCCGLCHTSSTHTFPQKTTENVRNLFGHFGKMIWVCLLKVSVWLLWIRCTASLSQCHRQYNTTIYGWQMRLIYSPFHILSHNTTYRSFACLPRFFLLSFKSTIIVGSLNVIQTWLKSCIIVPYEIECKLLMYKFHFGHTDALDNVSIIYVHHTKNS